MESRFIPIQKVLNRYVFTFCGSRLRGHLVIPKVRYYEGSLFRTEHMVRYSVKRNSNIPSNKGIRVLRLQFQSVLMVLVWLILV